MLRNSDSKPRENAFSEMWDAENTAQKSDIPCEDFSLGVCFPLHCGVDDGSSRPSRMFALSSSFVELTNACATLRHSTKSRHLKQTLVGCFESDKKSHSKKFVALIFALMRRTALRCSKNKHFLIDIEYKILFCLSFWFFSSMKANK